MIRYTSVSVVTTVVSFATIALVFGLNITSSEVLATMTGNLVAAVPAYFLHRSWVWGKHGRSHLVREVLPFWVMVVLGIGVSTLGAMGVRHLVQTHTWSHLIDTALVSFANIVSFAVFWVLKIILFNRIFRVDSLADFEARLDEGEVREVRDPRRHDDAGVALVATIVVVMIIAVLAALVLSAQSPPRHAPLAGTARATLPAKSGAALSAASVAACRADFATITAALGAYRALHGSNPPAGTTWATGGLLAAWPVDSEHLFIWNGRLLEVQPSRGEVSRASAGTPAPASGCFAP